MKYNCCDALLHKLAINPDNINFCCSPYDNKLSYIDNYNGEVIDIEDYKQRRNYYIEKFKKGDIPEPCQGCSFCEEKEWDEQIGFKFISISTRTKCNCNCKYCFQSKDDPKIKHQLNTQITHDIKPVIKDLYNENLILENCIYIIGGGEPTVFPEGELEYLTYIGISSKANIFILTNGIIYNETIAKVLSMAKAGIMVSIDAGTKSTYEKIKGVKEFDTVWKNMSKYIKATKGNSLAYVNLKYIICPGINDNIEEIKAFIKKCFDVGCHKILISIEYDWFSTNKDKPISNELKESLLYLNSLKNKGVEWNDTPDWFEAQIR